MTLKEFIKGNRQPLSLLWFEKGVLQSLYCTRHSEINKALLQMEVMEYTEEEDYMEAWLK